MKLPFYLFSFCRSHLFSGLFARTPLLSHPISQPAFSLEKLYSGSCAYHCSHAAFFQGFLSLSFLFLFIDDTANDGIQAYVGLVGRANVAYCFQKYQALV